MTALFYPDDPSAWTSREVLRLLLVPTIATLLFVGGIYWIRLQPPAGPASREQNSIVQVRLLPSPSPAPIPVAPVTQPPAAALASRTDVTPENSDQAPDNTAATPTREPMPTEPTVPSLRPTPSPADAPPNSIAAKFQQALLRHVARYQRYPNAARLGRLHGAVETFFSMRRDGTLLDVWVKTSSGQLVLDRAAVDAIRRAQPLPLIPSELPDRLNIQITLVFEPT
ncbi:energy transducer TonB family protein [Bradyrhizobium tropiciagri]|uniref:energy transducer TonB family protein n=1 Tax=Bradyrhizobium tropiciagri TaxID=312253 RepID=UPI0020124835|nr:energy transducer TonB [Bradyrhizobium tropiciagri]